MALGARLELRQTQALMMTPQLQQAIRLLQLSNVELDAAVAEEVERNPLLLHGDGTGEARTPVSAATPDAAVDVAVTGNAAGTDAPLDADWVGERFHHDCAADNGGGGGEAFDWERVAGADGTLADHLTAQLHWTCHARLLPLAIAVAHALDEAGYLREPLAALAEREHVTLEEAEEALAAVQRCEPTGVGARDLAECLALQAREADRYDPCMALLIANLPLLAAGRMRELQRLCRVDAEDLADMVRELRGYDPRPGCRIGGGCVESVTPDVFVRRSGDGWVAEINGDTLPDVRLDRAGHGALVAGARDRGTRQWVGERLAGARWLVRALEQRRRTVEAVAAEIVRRQQAFFERGPRHLRPLTLAQVAEAVGVHESTVSRVVANKWLSCPRGTFELRWFFASGVASGDGDEGASAIAVKAAIRLLVASETQQAVLSDDALAARLRAQGFEVARRTVAKYREADGIGSSTDRRRRFALSSHAG